MKRIIVAAVLFIAMVSPAFAGGPPEQNIRQAFQMILSQADANRDGKLSANECMAIYTDKKMAEKNCTFWDVNKDGTITEDEYVKQASSFGRGR